MANKVIKYDSFKKGDTPSFTFLFTQPYMGFTWIGKTADIAMTSVLAPTDNSGAGVIRLAVAPTINATNNSATFVLQPTVLESKALTAGAEYKVEIQLHDGSTNVVTPITGKVTVEQDYVI